METLTVCTYLTEMPADQTRELSSDHKSRAQLDFFIEVGKAVISTNFRSFKKSLVFFKKKYLSKNSFRSKITPDCTNQNKAGAVGLVDKYLARHFRL